MDDTVELAALDSTELLLFSLSAAAADLGERSSAAAAVSADDAESCARPDDGSCCCLLSIDFFNERCLCADVTGGVACDASCCCCCCPSAAFRSSSSTTSPPTILAFAPNVVAFKAEELTRRILPSFVLPVGRIRRVVVFGVDDDDDDDVWASLLSVVLRFDALSVELIAGAATSNDEVDKDELVFSPGI